MSSAAVRTAIKSFIETNAGSETLVDITAAIEELKDLLSENEVQPDAPWLGVQFIGGEETPIALAATNDQGKYREYGTVVLHFCDVGRIGVGDLLLTRAEVLINLFRGRRIGDIVVDGLTMMNFDAGATLQFEGGYVSGSFQVSFYRDVDL